MKTNRYAIVGLAAAILVSFGVGGAGASADRATETDKNIVQVATEAGQFKTLTRLAQRAGLVGALTGSAKLTVFAPTDKAFAKVPKATLRSLERNRAQLRAVLLYHVVKGNVKAAQVVKLRRAKTLNGASVRIGVKGSRVYLNRKVRVVKTDIEASNGTIHVIDGVLIPPMGLVGSPRRPAGQGHRPGAEASGLYHVWSAGVAQLVERRSCKAVVVGSSPTSGS
jgi:uncharacterized surface protein with fasciclin (FAS1) repeats